MENKKELFMYIGAGVLIGAFISIVVFLNFKLPEGTTTNNFNATFLTIVALIVGYYWGSSKGSSDKNKLLEPTNEPASVAAVNRSYEEALALARINPGTWFDFVETGQDGKLIYARVKINMDGTTTRVNV
jgi:hypothetical protein